MDIKKRREFNIRKIGEYYYITHRINTEVREGVYYFKDNIIHHSTWIEYGEQIYATNDPSVPVSRLPSMLIPKMKASNHKIITLKVEIFNWRPEICGGIWDGGSYEYDMKPITDKRDCIIVDMWKL